MSLAHSCKEQLDAGSILEESQNACRDEEEFVGTDEIEKPRSLSLDSIVPVSGANLSSSDLPEADAACNSTFVVQLDSQTSPTAVQNAGPAEIMLEDDSNQFTAYATSTPTEAENSAKEHFVRNCAVDLSQDSTEFNVLDTSFTTALSDQEGRTDMDEEACQIQNETYILADVAESSTPDRGGCTYSLSKKHSTPVGNGDNKAGTTVAASSYLKADGRLQVRKFLGKYDGAVANRNDLSTSFIDVFKDDDDGVNGFFVMEWPSGLAKDCHDRLLAASHRLSSVVAQTQNEVPSSVPVSNCVVVAKFSS